MSGNHLILFDGKKQQIIKLDADIDIKAKNPKPIRPKTAIPPGSSNPSYLSKTYAQNGEVRHGPGDLVDPASVISQNKQSYDRMADRNRKQREEQDLRKAKTAAEKGQAPQSELMSAEEKEEDLIEREMMRAAVNEMEFEQRVQKNVQESQCTM